MIWISRLMDVAYLRHGQEFRFNCHHSEDVPSTWFLRKWTNSIPFTDVLKKKQWQRPKMQQHEDQQQRSDVAFRRDNQAYNPLQFTLETMRWVIIAHCPQHFVARPGLWMRILILWRNQWYLITGLGTCKVCTEAVHGVALWTRT